MQKILLILVGILISINTHAVTYQDIQKDPINLQLNLKYAKEQQEIGNVKNAMVTIERLLFYYPNNIDLKVYYIQLLTKLGSIAKAMQTIKTLLEDEETNQKIKEQLQQIAKRIEESKKPPKKLYINGNMITTFSNYSNVTSMSTLNQQYVSDSLSAYASGTVKNDTTFSINPVLSAVYLKDQKNRWGTNLVFLQQDQTRGDGKMFRLLSGTLTHTYLDEKFLLNTFVSLSYTDSHTSFDSRNETIGSNINYIHGEKLSSTTGYSLTNIQNNSTDKNSTAHEKNALLHSFFFEPKFMIDQNRSISTNLSYNFKNADRNINRTNGRSINLGYKHLFKDKYQASINFKRTYNQNHAPDALVVSDRSKKEYISNFILSLTGPIGKTGWSFSSNVNIQESMSNIINYTTSSNTYSLTLIKPFAIY